MFNFEKLLQGLSFRDRSLFRNLFKREAVDFNQGNNAVVVGGKFGVRGQYLTLDDGATHPNVVTSEGQLYLLATGLAGGTAEAGWFLALWNNAVTPTEAWDAASFTATAGEITSNTEGYSETTRPVWTPDTPVAEPINNSASPATFSIVTATSLTIQGAALISGSAKGGTTGVLMSAAAFTGGARTQYNGDVFKLVYEESLQPL